MAADLLLFGLEQTAALTVALLMVMILRRPIRALFGARAAYALWLLAPAAMLAVALPGRIEAPATQTPAPAVQTVAPRAIAPPTVTAQTDDFTLADLKPRRPASWLNPKDHAALLLLLWGAGVVGAGGLMLVRQRRFVASLGVLQAETRAEGRVFHAARIDVGPALVGALRPRIILPGDFARRFTPEEQAVVVAHERAHLTGGDAQINLLTAALRILFWFHPLLPIAAHRLRLDQELACDETVVARLPRRLYAETMLKAQLTPLSAPLACQWPGEGPALRQRIARLGQPLSRRRRTFGAVLAVTAVAAGGAAAWAAQPPRQVDEPAPPRTRALLDAVRDGRNSEAAAMVRAGADAGANVFGEGSPLIIAAREGQLDLVDVMLEQGADPDRVVLGDGSALISAADNGDLAMVDLLLAKGADADLPVRGDGSPLIAAASGGHVEIIDRLVAAGAQVNRIVPGDETALINAARQGQLEAVQRLVEAGADVNLSVMSPRAVGPDERRSPLGMARRAGRAEVVAYLTARGARP